MRNGKNATRNNTVDPDMSYMISSFPVEGYFTLQAENSILMISWAAKKMNMAGPLAFHVRASAILPLIIRERLCDNPQDIHGCPVTFSCMQTTG